jgi:hypothetical protein
MHFEDHLCTTHHFVDHEKRFGDPQSALSCTDDPQLPVSP